MPEDFRVHWDEDHTFDFFEDDNANGYWAHGSLPDDEFVRQANEYNRVCDAEPDEPFTAADVRMFWGIIRVVHRDGDWRVFPCEPTTSGAALVKVIDR